MIKEFNKIIFFSAVFLFGIVFSVSAHQPEIIFNKTGNITINNPEVSKAFYDELKGAPRDYFINSDKDFNLYLNLLVPAFSNPDGKYSANVFSIINDKEELFFSTDILSTGWSEYYEEFGRDYYYKGPEFEKQVSAGKYKIEVFSQDNNGKYVLAVGKTESFNITSLLNVYWQLPYLKLVFFKTDVLQFFLTPFGIGLIGVIGGLFILIALINYIIGAIKASIMHNLAKTLFLASNAMAMKNEIVKLLQKPAYDVNVGFIITASKQEQDISYVKQDIAEMNELGFNVEEIDIEGKNEFQLIQLLKVKDIIFVAGENTFYLLNAMKKCNFDKVLKKLLKQGIVYIGSSAGSIVIGKTIQTAGWYGDENIVKTKDLKGLNILPFDIFVHYEPKYAEIIKQKMPDSRKRLKNLRIITDNQAILIQNQEEILIGEGEQVIL